MRVLCMLLTGFGEGALERQHCFTCQDGHQIECGVRQIFENRFPELAGADDTVRLYHTQMHFCLYECGYNYPWSIAT